MKITIIKKKAASRKEMARVEIDIAEVETLKELLQEICLYEFQQHHNPKQDSLLDTQHIKDMATIGKVSFGSLYNENNEDIEKAMAVMLQDFEDGLFRVFLNRQEYTKLDEKLVFKEVNEVVFIRLVMMAGRLW